MNNRDHKFWRILLIDDDKDDYILTREMLRQAQGRKITLDWASSYEEGKEQIQSNYYDAVMVDYDLGLRNGIELIRNTTSQGYRAPLILYTGRGSYDVDVEAMKAGASLYLPKAEINPLLLERSIRYAIERKCLEQERTDLIESIQDGFFALDRDWRITYVNRRAAQSAGVEPEELIGQNIWEAFPKLIGTPLEQNYRLVMEDRTPRTLEMQGVYQGIWYNISIYPFQEGISVYWQDISEKKKAEEAIRRSEATYRAIARNLPGGGVVVVDRDLRYLVAEGPLWSNLGIAPEELEGHTAREVLNLRTAIIAEERYQQALDGVTSSYETEHFGRIVWSHYQPLRDEGGQVIAAMVLALDITERKRAEEAFRESEQRYSTLFNAKTNGISHCRVIIDEQGRPIDYEILQVNEAYEQITGIKRANIEGHRAREVFPGIENFAFDYIGNYGRVALEGGELNIEVFFEPLRQWLSIYIYSPKPGEFTAIFTDISQRKQAETLLKERNEALQESEKRLRGLVDGNIIGINIRDAAGRIHDANRAFLEMIGYGWDNLEAGDLGIKDLTPPAYWAMDQEAIQEALANGECKPYEKEYIHKDGHTIPAMVGYTRLDEMRDDYIGFVLDLSELKKTQTTLQEYAEKLKRSNQELEGFAFVASHDLQEPLRKIESLGNMILDGSTNLTEQQKDHLSRMRKSAERMRKMVDGLLQISRLSTHGQTFQTVNLRQITLEVLSDLEIQIKRTNAVVEVCDLPVIKGDRLQMRQLLQNLIGNALKFQPPGGKPHVKVFSSQPTPETVQIMVMDNGIGFDQQHAESLFQPFKRLVGKSEYEGSGIGLAISRKIVERHKGEITARSKKGNGTTFIITLPIK